MNMYGYVTVGVGSIEKQINRKGWHTAEFMETEVKRSFECRPIVSLSNENCHDVR